MNLHHNILKNKLKITVPKIDQMIDAANLAGAYGSKIIGSGCGGSIVAVSRHPEPLYYTYLYEHLPSKENRYYLSRVAPIKNYY